MSKTIPSKTVEGVYICIKNQERERCEALDLSEKGRASWRCRVLDRKNPHIRNNGDGTVTRLDVNSGVYTMDMWVYLDETGPDFSWHGQ